MGQMVPEVGTGRSKDVGLRWGREGNACCLRGGGRGGGQDVGSKYFLAAGLFSLRTFMPSLAAAVRIMLCVVCGPLGNLIGLLWDRSMNGMTRRLWPRFEEDSQTAPRSTADLRET